MRKILKLEPSNGYQTTWAIFRFILLSAFSYPIFSVKQKKPRADDHTILEDNDDAITDTFGKKRKSYATSTKKTEADR